MKDKEERKRGGSLAGYSFLSLYVDCQRKWYLSHVCRIEPEFTPKPLTFGSAIHEWREYFYTHGDAGKDQWINAMSAQRSFYEDEKVFEEDLRRGWLMLRKWLDTWSEHDLMNWEVLAVEEELTVPLTDDWIITIKPDLRIKDRISGNIYIVDCKTTGYSVKSPYDSMEAMDQVTCYMWGLRKLGKPVNGLIVDVMYNRKSVYKAERPGIIVRSKADLDNFEEEMIGLYSEIHQKMLALEEGSYDIRQLFRRNGRSCSGAFKCSFSDVCRHHIIPGKPPLGYVQRADR